MRSSTPLGFASTGKRASRSGVWRARAFQSYRERQKRSKEELRRPILAGLFIGAHAALDRYSLMTLDQRLYCTAYPKLEILTF